MRALFALPVLASALAAQPLSEDLGAPGLWQAWKRAQTTARVLYITAHPDDEDAATLTYLARGLGADVTLLSLTRGESGANVITGDFFAALGKLRELELEKAAQYYGVRVRHTSFTDFGFSKNVAETWRVWDQAKLLAEARRVCDEVRPQVIMSRFHGSARDGHGQHTASGEIAKALFAAPGQWRPSKLYTGNWNESDAWTIQPPVDTYDAVLGRTYAEIGLEGYRQHRSQGMDRMLNSPLMRRPRYYKLEGSHVGPASKEESFFERLGREAEPPIELQAALRDVGRLLRLEDPKPMLPALERALAIALRTQDHHLELKIAELRGRAQGTWRPAQKSETPHAPLSVAFDSEVSVVPAGRASAQIAVVLRSFSKEAIAGRLRVTGQPDRDFRLTREGEELRLPYTVAVAKAADYPLEAVATIADKTYSTEVRPITAPGLRTTYLRKPARHVVRVVDVKVAPGLRVGYVMGTGDDVPSAIRQLGVPVELLSPEDVATGDLSRFTTILLGIRAYAAHEDVKQHNRRLLDFAALGGTLIVQYNTPEFDQNYGPYPYTMTQRTEEVSEENSPVRILQPNHPVFRVPNAITLSDFNGWTEQRGSKFWMTWSQEYVPLLETHDTGQAPQEGGWLEAKHGKGLYIYCAYAWYRQLPAGVPGAYRLFANLLSRRP
ncbi:MAG: PIG-L family deacetylase [Bryobacteraceae bacterium]|nr:PIG-L family deacetylase [Bryobacteraceae bacterium]